MKLTRRGRIILVVIVILTAVIVIRMARKGTGAVSIEEIERRDGVAVAVENPVRMDFTDYVYCDGEVDVSARYALRSSIDEIVEAVHVDVGDIVKEGQILVEFRSGDIRADISAKRAAHDEAKRNYERYKVLLDKGGVSKNMVEAKRTASESAAAALRRAESKMEFAQVRAPMGDVPIDDEGSVQVEARFVDPGEHKGKGKELITLVDLSTAEIRAMVPEGGVRSAKVGGEIEFRLEDEKAWRTAVVTRVGPSTKDSNRFFDVFVRLDNERTDSGWVMRPGMYAQVRIPRAVHGNALAVRSGAIRRRGARRSVFVVKALQTQRIDVETGLTSGGYIQLKGDAIGDDDTIVSNPRGNLRDGTKVRIVEKSNNGNT